MEKVTSYNNLKDGIKTLAKKKTKRSSVPAASRALKTRNEHGTSEKLDSPNMLFEENSEVNESRDNCESVGTLQMATDQSN